MSADDDKVAEGAFPLQPVRKTEGVIAVDRALSILDALSSSKGPLSLAALSRMCRMVKPTVLRSLVSLEKASYVLRLPNGSYQLGSKAFRLGASYASSFNLEMHVMPILKHLAAVSGESASFNVREGNLRLCLFKVESPQVVRDAVDVRIVTSVDETSTGVALSTLRQTDLGEGPRPVYYTSGINHAQLASVSTPIYKADGELSGAMTLSGPVDRFGPQEAEKLAADLTDAANRLTSLIAGQQFPQPGHRIIVGAGARGRTKASGA